MCHVLPSGASCCIIHIQIWPFGLLSLIPSSTPAIPSHRQSPPLPICAARTLRNLHSNIKSTSSIIPMAGALSEPAWAQAAQLRPRLGASTGMGDMNYINLLNFFCESFLASKGKGGGRKVCEDSQELFYILKYCEGGKPL